jgi:hypothetical protein
MAGVRCVRVRPQQRGRRRRESQSDGTSGTATAWPNRPHPAASHPRRPTHHLQVLQPHLPAVPAHAQPLLHQRARRAGVGVFLKLPRGGIRPQPGRGGVQLQRARRDARQPPVGPRRAAELEPARPHRQVALELPRRALKYEVHAADEGVVGQRLLRVGEPEAAAARLAQLLELGLVLGVAAGGRAGRGGGMRMWSAQL